jgi:hypothetical protein
MEIMVLHLYYETILCFMTLVKVKGEDRTKVLSSFFEFIYTSRENTLLSESYLTHRNWLFKREKSSYIYYMKRYFVS